MPSETGDAVLTAAATAGQDAVRTLLDQLQASPLAAIAFTRGAEREVDARLQSAVQSAREAGHTWAQIGQVLGSSRQAAFQRFSRPADPRTGAPMSPVLPDAPDRAMVLLANLAAGRWADARADFGKAVAQKLSAGELAAVWARLAGMAGPLEHTGRPVVYQAGDFTVADIPLSFEAGELAARIAFDQQGKVAGLHFVPPGLA